MDNMNQDNTNPNMKATPHGAAPTPQAATYAANGAAQAGTYAGNGATKAARYSVVPSSQALTWEERYQPKEDIETLNFREKMASKLGLASLIYALFSTFCIYDNWAGITMPLFAIGSLIYMVYGLKQYDIKVKKYGWFYGAVIIALALSNFLTGNLVFHFFNCTGMILLIFTFLLHNVYDDSRWNFSKTTFAIIESFFCSIGALSDYTKDMKVLKKRKAEHTVEKNHTFKYVLIGLLISIPLVAVLLTLLSQADMIFGDLMKTYFRFKFDFDNAFGIAITFAVLYFGSYCVLRFFSKKTINEEVIEKRNMEPVIAITVLSIVSVIYLLFSVIQIVYLFWGGVKLPEKYTYAEYAREGFFQLLAVSIINFLMVLFVNKRFREHTVLKLLMTVISLCTYIMIASSCTRMLLYIDVYLLTTLRILVLWGLAVLSLLFIAVIISIFKYDFPLFKYCVIVVSILYLFLSFSHPDHVIADYNLSNIAGKDAKANISCDYDYLTNLSTDAAPVIAQYDGEWVREYFLNNSEFYRNRSIRQFNLSYYTAKILSETK